MERLAAGLGKTWKCESQAGEAWTKLPAVRATNLVAQSWHCHRAGTCSQPPVASNGKLSTLKWQLSMQDIVKSSKKLLLLHLNCYTISLCIITSCTDTYDAPEPVMLPAM